MNTGFRAPSLHQLYFTNVSTQFVSGPGGDLVPVEVGTLRNDSPAARALGIPPLKEETSTNFSGGIVASLSDAASLTVDAFRVTVNDRIVISGRFNESSLRPTAPDVAAALLAGGTNSAQFFTNAAQTETAGVEFSFNSVHFWDNGSLLDWRISGMYANTDLTGGINAPQLLVGLENIIFGSQDRSILTEWQPNTRLQGTADYTIGRFRLGGGLRYFGSWWVQEGASARQEFGGKWLTDLDLGMRIWEKTELTLGVHNLFNVVPDENMVGQSRSGRLEDSAGNVIIDSPGIFVFSRRSAPFGFNGGFLYARLSVRW